MTPQKDKTSKTSLITTKKKSSKVKDFSLNDDFKKKPLKKQKINEINEKKKIEQAT